ILSRFNSTSFLLSVSSRNTHCEYYTMTSKKFHPPAKTIFRPGRQGILCPLFYCTPYRGQRQEANPNILPLGKAKRAPTKVSARFPAAGSFHRSSWRGGSPVSPS